MGVWCAAAWHLQDRDQAVGWDAVPRAERLKLVVQLRRFLVVAAARRPNLASQCLAAGVRELVGQWDQEHEYRPLLAESFSDPATHAGTIYQATNWTLAGVTKGFSKGRADFYVPNGRPKKLWLLPLAPQAYALLCARELPDACRGALGDRSGIRSPLPVAALQSLYDALRLVPDPRRPQSRRHPLPALLTLIALGLLMGAPNVLAIWHRVACLSQSQRVALGLRVRHAGSRRLKLPGYDALNDVLAAVDPGAYARALTAWLQAHAGRLPRSLARDGKAVGDGRCGLIVTLCRQEDGRPVAMAPASGKKQDSEVPVARELLADPQVDLVNALVTADPLHNNAATARVIVDKGGDYLVGAKGNTAKRLQAASQALAGSPFCPDHGERSRAQRHPQGRGGPGRPRRRRPLRRPLGPEGHPRLDRKNQPNQTHSHTRIFLTSLRPEEQTRGADATRGHWGVETRNHRKRDASLWHEDDHRHPAHALNLLLRARPVLCRLMPRLNVLYSCPPSFYFARRTNIERHVWKRKKKES